MLSHGPASWSPPAPVARKGLAITATAVESVLYIASPAGLSQLGVELNRRGYDFTTEELKACAAMVVSGNRATRIDHDGVTMYCLNGLSR